jgi:hypothetical protein
MSIHAIENPRVAGSIPASATMRKPAAMRVFPFDLLATAGQLGGI